MKPQNTKHTRSTHLALGTAALLAASALQTEAALVAQENFDYSTSTAIAGLNGGTGWSGAWSTTATSLKTASGADSLWFGQPGRIVDGTGHIGLNSADASNLRVLSTTIPLGSETLYFSMLFTVANSTNAAITASFGRTDGLTRGTVQLDDGKLGVDATTGGIVETAASVYTTAQNYMLVMKRVGGNVAGVSGIYASVFVGDGTPGTTLAAEPVTWQVSELGATGITVDRMFIDIDGGGSVTRLDDIRIATDWDSAVGVPEPGSLMLVGLSCLTVFCRRRR